jgi:arsenite methyltransferase
VTCCAEGLGRKEQLLTVQKLLLDALLQDPAMIKAAVLAAAALLTPITCRTQVSNLGSSYRASLFSLRQDSFAQPLQQSDVDALCSSKLVIFGEVHETSPCIEVQCRTAACLLSAMSESSSTAGTLHIVLEHFNFESQPALSAYAGGSMPFDSLAESGGYEGHDITAYRALLQLARDHPGRINLHAGFIPRHYARMVMREGVEPALAAAKAKGYVAEDETCSGSEAHYNFFESLLTGRSMHHSSSPPADTYRGMFPAQIIKDAAMAHKVVSLIRSSHQSDRFLVICGVGHSGYSHGVPERIFASLPQLRQQSFRIMSVPIPATVDFDSLQHMQQALLDELGNPGSSDPADICLAFAQVESAHQQPRPASASEAVKSETAAAYNSVAHTAHVPGDFRRARALMLRLGYSEEQISLAGSDAPNFQGVGSPHAHAGIQPGDSVADIGSGLGIDSFIAADAVGESGSVIGIDISDLEVRHSTTRAAARGLTNLRFEVGDLERLPLPDACVDVVISNGAFCLAPDKAAAFREVARVLKPGGRFSICTSTVKSSLQPGVWPLCMRMFAELSSLKPACEAAGLQHVRVDDSDSLMAFELPDDSGVGSEGLEQEDSSSGRRRRNQVHVDSAEFDHLAGCDMNQLCARVVIAGVKPS